MKYHEILIMWDWEPRAPHKLLSPMGNSQDEREEEGEGTAAIVDLVTGWRTDGDDGLEEVHRGVGAAEPVGGLADKLPVLILLDGDGPEDGVDVLIVVDEVSDPVVLVGGEGVTQPVLVPLDGGGRVGVNLTLQVHVELESLAQPLPGYLDGGRVLHLNINVPPSSGPHHIGGHTVVSSSVLPLNFLDGENVPLVDEATSGQLDVVLSPPVYFRRRIAAGVTFQDDPVPLPGDDRPGGVVGDDGRPPHVERDHRLHLVSQSHQNLTP